MSIEELLGRLRTLLRRDEQKRRMREEADLHLQMLIEENRARGMSESEALRAAQNEFGSRTEVEEQFHAQAGLPLVESIAQDIDSIGGQLDAFTAKEYASYYIKVLDEHVRGEEHEAGDRAARPAAVDERDRSAVAVADEHGPLDPECVQQRGERDERLVVHVAHLAVLV